MKNFLVLAAAVYVSTEYPNMWFTWLLCNSFTKVPLEYVLCIHLAFVILIWMSFGSLGSIVIVSIYNMVSSITHVSVINSMFAFALRDLPQYYYEIIIVNVVVNVLLLGYAIITK